MNALKNIGQLDKIIRMLAGLALIGISFYMLGGISETMGITALVIGAILILTGLINICPLYKILGLSSRSQKA